MNPLIKTKLRIPALRPHLLPRPYLVARVTAGLAGPLTLIAAPAGFGKTTAAVAGLTAANAAGESRAVWLSLDAGDNENRRFLACLTAALQTVAPHLGRTAAELLESPQLAPAEAILAALVNDLFDWGTDWGGDLVLVLDDYHVISSPAIHAAVTFLIEHGPPSLHLLITTRADPPLPLARLRARGQLTELRAADLRFSTEETAAFLNDVLGLELDAGLVRLLDARTEGWIAGLQLAALRLGGRGPAAPDAAEAFVRRFSGAQRFILDYLLEEVLEQQEPAVQRFLLLTAPLPRLCGSLCDAVLRAGEDAQGEATGDSPAAGDAPSSTELLLALERTNVFLIPLDDERRWYRYHHLFADLLRVRLREWRPGLEGRLHAAAAAWLEEHGQTAEAVDAALAAGDPLWAARLVEQNTEDLLARGELGSLLGSIAALPADVRRQRPVLCLQQAYALAFAGQVAEASSALDLAEQSSWGTAQATTTLTGATLAVRAMLAVMAGSEERAVDLAQRALAQLPTGALWDRAAACWALGYGKRSLGDLDTARVYFSEQIRLARAIPNVWTLVTGLTDLALVLHEQGDLRQARSLLEEALEAAVQEGARGLGYIARTETALAGCFCDMGDLDAAERLLAGAFAHVERWPNPNHVVYAHLLAARVQRMRGDLVAAAAALREAHAICQSAPVTSVLRRRVALLMETAGDAVFTGAQANAAPAAERATQAGLIDPLSVRELEVLALLAQGLSNQEIAARLIIAPGTVKAHTAAIYRKLDVANRTEAAACARRLGLLT